MGSLRSRQSHTSASLLLQQRVLRDVGPRLRPTALHRGAGGSGTSAGTAAAGTGGPQGRAELPQLGVVRGHQREELRHGPVAGGAGPEVVDHAGQGCREDVHAVHEPQWAPTKLQALLARLGEHRQPQVAVLLLERGLHGSLPSSLGFCLRLGLGLGLGLGLRFGLGLRRILGAAVRVRGVAVGVAAGALLFILPRAADRRAQRRDVAQQEVEVVAASVVEDHRHALGRLGRDVARVAQRPEVPPCAVAVVQLLRGGRERPQALPAVSGAAGGRHGGLAGRLRLGDVHRRGGRAVDLQVRIAHQRGELGRGLGLVPQQVLALFRIRQRHLPGALGHLSVAPAAAVALPRGLLREARHALRALVLLAAAAVARRGAQGHPLPAGQRLEVVDQREVALVQQQQRRVLGGALVGRGPDVEVLLPVLPLGALPREDEDLHPAGVPTLEGVDVLKAHWAVGRQAGEVQPRIGQSGLPAGRAAPGSG